MLRCMQVGALAFLLTAPVVASQVPAGYHLGARVVLPDSLVEVSAGGRFRATIRRIARSQHEHDLLTLAERLYPDSATLLGVARDQTQREELLTFAGGVAVNAYKTPQRSAGIP